MDKYEQIYFDKLASECKEAGIGDVASGLWEGAKSLGKTFVVDPAVGMVTDTGSALRSAAHGDWSAAGGHALGALGNTLFTAGNAAMLVPGLGTAVGAGARGLGLAAKGLQGVKAMKGLSSGGRVVGLVDGALQRTQAAQKALGSTGAVQTGARGFVMTGNQVAGTAFNPAIRSGIAGRLAGASDKFRGLIGSTPLGKWTGFNFYNPNRVAPATIGGKAIELLKPVGTFMGLSAGADYLKGRGLESQFNDLAVDPNFREWMGPDRQDAWLEKARTATDKIKSMRVLNEGGYLDTYRKHLTNAGRGEAQSAADAARLDGYDAARLQNLG